MCQSGMFVPITLAKLPKFDNKWNSCYNSIMTNQDKLQWFGAASMIGAQVITSLFPLLYPYNIILFTLGGLAFLTWGLLVKNTPQIIVNIVGLAICGGGLYKAFV